MSTSRCFLIAPALARLIQKERGGLRVLEGYFPDREGRTSCVQVEDSTSFLILRTHGSAGLAEERVEVPRAHAEALLDVTAGEVDYLRCHLSIGAREIHLCRFIAPGPLDLIAVEFEREEDARRFSPLPWFGPEVTANWSYQHRAIAFEGVPEPLEIPLSDTVLNSLIDTLENRSPITPKRSVRTAAVQPPWEEPMKVEADSANDDDHLLRELARRLRPQSRYN
jgi:CYTH domain-containing protein